MAGVIVMTIAFAAAAGVRPGGGWFSPDVRYRQQTDAMLRGTFALQPVPHGQRADWAWGNGSQQVWGLGVPLLRMPGELIAHAAGYRGFPDRVTLIALFATVMFILTRAIDTDPLTGLAIAAAIGLLPGFITMSRTRLFVYEEAVVYAYLWAALQLALLIGAARSKEARWSAAAALVAGFGALIRPTQFLYALMTMLLLTIIHRRRPRIALMSATLFTAMTVTVLWTNIERFGDPLEFGQRVNSSRWVVDQFAKNFDYPYAHEPIVSAARELGAALFASAIKFNGDAFYAAGPQMHPAFSSTTRFREFYFSTGLAPFAALALIGYGLVVAGSRRQRWQTLDRVDAVVAVWSVLSFIALAVFYVRMPTMTSRYVMDFAAAVSAGVVALIVNVLSRDTRLRMPVIIVTATLIALGIVSAAVSPTHAASSLATASILDSMPPVITSGPAIPSTYRCGDRIEALGIPFNGVGWNWSGDCSLEAGTTLFVTLPEPDSCVRIEIDPESDRRDIEVKLAATRLVPHGGLYCIPSGFKRRPSGIEIMSLKWIAADRLAPLSHPSFKLRSITTTMPGTAEN